MTGVKRIVIADDDDDIRGLMVIAANRAGVEIVAAVDNGRAALDAVSEGGIDLAVLDISMPGLNGVEVADAIRGDDATKDTLILMVSASVQLHGGGDHQNQRVLRRVVAADRIGDLDAVQPRHRDVEHGQVDPALADGVERRASVVDGRDDLHARPVGGDHHQTADVVVVVRDHDALDAGHEKNTPRTTTTAAITRRAMPP